LGTRSKVKLTAPLQSVRLRPDARMEKEMEEKLRARYEQGLRDGEKRLNEQLLRQRSEVVDLQKGVLKALEEALPQVRSECETALVDLALEAARKLACSLAITREMIETLVNEALVQIENTHGAVVLLHPDDLRLLERFSGQEAVSARRPHLEETGAPGQRRIEFKPSTEVPRGGCLVQTRFGTLDARRETRFELMKRSLTD